MLGLRGCLGFSLFVLSGGSSLVVVQRLLTAEASLVSDHRLQGARASAVAVRRLCSCMQLLGSRAQAQYLWRTVVVAPRHVGSGIKLCLQRWQMDSFLLSHQGSPGFGFLINFFFSRMRERGSEWGGGETSPANKSCSCRVVIRSNV